jgi:hypothetical protein
VRKRDNARRRRLRGNWLGGMLIMYFGVSVVEGGPQAVRPVRVTQSGVLSGNAACRAAGQHFGLELRNSSSASA